MLFLICSERSGSNLITRMFDRHSEFCGPSPSHLIRILAKNRVRYGNLELAQNWKTLCADAALLLQNQLGIWKRKFTAEELETRVPEPTLAALIRYVYGQEAQANGKQRLFIKENHTVSFLPFLLAAFPDSRFVYLVRDPRDMALSYKQTLAHTGGVHEAVQVWLRDQQPGLEAYLHLNEGNRVHLLTYEELVSQPERALPLLCRFAGVNYEAKMLEFHASKQTRQNAGRIKAWENLQQPLLQQNFNKYRTGLTELEIRYTEAACAREMEFFGYQPDFEPSADLPELEQELLKFENQNRVAVSPPSDEELKIREARQKALQQVLSRHLPFRES